MYNNGNKGEGDLYRQSDEDFWNESQVGLDFGENESSSSFYQFVPPSTDSRNVNRFNVEYAKELSRHRSTIKTSTPIQNPEIKRESKLPQILVSPIQIKAGKLTSYMLKDRTKINCYDAVMDMILGQEFNFKPFKALVEKQKLLKASILSHDGNAILAVVLFLKNTLKKSIFQKEIMVYPDAVNMYLSYLHEGRQIHELADMLLMLRKPVDAALLKYEEATLIHDQKRRLSVLSNLLNTYCQHGTVERYISESVLEHCMCMEDYRVLIDHRVVSEQCDENIFEAIIGRREITDSCVVHALVFSILHFYNVAEIANISPATIRARYKVPSQKYEWCAFITLAAARSYQNLEKLFLTKKWLGGIKLLSAIPYQTMLEILSMFKAPIEVMEKYCRAIDYQEDRLALAMKYHCNTLAIELLKKKRSRSACVAFQRHLDEDSDDYRAISCMLRSRDIKWKQ